MGTNENLLQINTFVKGMNTDVSDMMLDPQSYRYAENVRLISDSYNNSGELRMIEGLKNLYTFLDVTPAYIGYARGYTVAIVYNSSSWSILVSKDKGFTWNSIFGECTDLVWNPGDTPHISAVINYETDDNIKLYFVDDTCRHGIMSINITKSGYGNNIKKLIGNIARVPLPPTIHVSSANGSIDSPKVLYAYRLYDEFGSASNVSILSRLLSLYKAPGEGYGKVRLTNRAVDVDIRYTLPFYNKIEIYRILYYELGQKPRVFLIRDTDFTKDVLITDNGSYKHELSVEELLALDNTEINPKIIENKNNYLFAANLSYARDLVDKKFLTWDARSVSTGMTYDSITDTYTHKQFSNGYKEYNYDWWHPTTNSTEIGGNGKHVDWRLKYVDNKILRNKSTEETSGCCGFKHGETYRFGIILYDEDHRASSVKWVADIRIPPLNASNDISVLDPESFIYKTCEIEFTVKDLPTGCSGYEIVRCERKLADKHTVFLGIVGGAMVLYTNTPNDGDYTNPLQSTSEPYIYPSGLLSLQTNFATQWEYDTAPGEYTNSYTSYKYLQFACPEYCYMPDSARDLLEQYRYNVKLELSHTFDAYYNKSDLDHQEMNLFTIGRAVLDVNPYRWRVSDNDGLIGQQQGFYTWISPLVMQINIDTDGYILPDLKNSDVAPSGSNAYCNYVTPSKISDPFVKHVAFTEISDIAYCSSPKWNDFAKDGKFTYRDDVTVIGGKQFINWSTPLINDRNFSGLETAFRGYAESPLNWGVPGNWDPNRAYYPIGAGGSCILLYMKDREGLMFTKTQNIAPISIANIVKDCVPYGGYTKDAIDDSVYYSYGDYSASAGKITVSTGDSYVGAFVYNALHMWNDPVFICASKMSTIYMVPIESDIDINAQCGYQFSPTKALDFCVQDEPCSMSGFNYIQELSSYIYNNVYHTLPTTKSFTYQRLLDSNYDIRIHHSSVKDKNEIIDDWLLYKPMDYLDCDSKYGSITQLDNFRDSLIFWQNRATGVISSNERNVIQNTDGVNLILGNGGVLQRYDYITTVYGMKYGQFANAQSDNSEYWWDGINKEILQYSKSGIPTPLSTTKGVKTYLLYGTENTLPHVVYDNKYKEVIFSVVNGQSISYTEQLLAFLSVYTFALDLDTTTDDSVLCTNQKYLSALDLCDKDGYATAFNGVEIYPKIKTVVNKNSTTNKVFDIQTFGGRIYGGNDLSSLNFIYSTPLKQEGRSTGDCVTNKEYDFRLAIPRNNNSDYGDRLRGKTMQCELSSTSNSTDFSLQYITTKYRISWS